MYQIILEFRDKETFEKLKKLLLEPDSDFYLSDIHLKEGYDPSEKSSYEERFDSQNRKIYELGELF